MRLPPSASHASLAMLPLRERFQASNFDRSSNSDAIFLGGSQDANCVDGGGKYCADAIRY